MRKYILIIGGVLLLLNTAIGFLISSYSNFNILFVDINLILSVALCLILSIIKIDSTLKITLAIIFIFTGFVRALAALSTSNSIQDNPVIIGILIVLTIEIVVTIIANSVKKSSPEKSSDNQI